MFNSMLTLGKNKQIVFNEQEKAREKSNKKKNQKEKQNSYQTP